MKKLLIMVVISTLHINCAHGMLYDLAKAAVHKLSKYTDPEGYVLDSQNKKLYEAVLNDFNEKPISTLRTTQYPDHNGILQTLEFTLARALERDIAASDCISKQSLIQDPNKQDGQKLYDMITVNEKNITDLILSLALHALQEQQNGKIPVSSGSIKVDVLYFKITLLSKAEQLLLRSLQDDDEPMTVEEKLSRAETSILSLSEEQLEKVLQKRVLKKIISSPVVNPNKQTRNNTPTRSREGTSKQSSDQDEGNSSKPKEIPVARSKKQAGNNSSAKSVDKDQQEQLGLEENQKKIGSNAEKQEDEANIGDDLDNQDDASVDNT